MMMTCMRMRLSKMMMLQVVEDGKMACQQQGEHLEVEPKKEVTAEHFKTTLPMPVLQVLPF